MKFSVAEEDWALWKSPHVFHQIFFLVWVDLRTLSVASEVTESEHRISHVFLLLVFDENPPVTP